MCLGTEAGLPLGLNSSFLAAVTEANVAPSKAWGLYAGDRSLSPVDGELTVGGYDPARVAGNFTTFPLGNWSLQQPCPLQVTASSITYDHPHGSSDSLLSENTIACIEPFQDRFTFTPNVASRFANITNYNSSYANLTYPTSNSPNGSITITLDNNYTTVIPNSELITLHRGSDQSGHYAITNSSIVDTAIASNANSNPATVQPLLGGIYLTFNYLLVDYESGQFQMAPAVPGTQTSNPQGLKAICTPTPSPSQSASPGPSASPAPSKSSHSGAIAGGTIGGVAGLAFIGALIFLSLRQLQRRRRWESTVAPTETTYPWSPSMQSPSMSDPQSPFEMPLVR